MGRMRKVLLAAFVAALVIAVTACGRSDSGSGSSGAGTSAAGTSSGQPTVRETMESTGESGGILQDMVDGVEQGMDDMLNGNDGNSGSGTNDSGNAGGTGTSGGSGTSHGSGTSGSMDGGANGQTHENVNSVTSGKEEQTR